MAKVAEHKARRTDIRTPVLYLRGDAGPASTVLEDYAEGLRHAGVRRLETATLHACGEYAPEEAPKELIAHLRRFCALSGSMPRPGKSEIAVVPRSQ
jgi:hypothetical protein